MSHNANRIFFHIDVNSAFLSWSAIKKLNEGSDIDLRNIPSVIGGDSKMRHGIVLAKSIPAKNYGIYTSEPLASARRKCPFLTVEPPNHTYYEEKSKLLMQHLAGICPDIEQVSIDECYMDFTPIAHLFPSYTDAAHHIKDTINSRFGFTVNIGISDRKVLAKMASDFKKPDMVHTLFHTEIKEKMWPLPVSSLYMCGQSSIETLKKLGILTIGDLATADPKIIQFHLKSHGKLLFEYANGIDSSTVATAPQDIKGIGNSTTLSKDLMSCDEAYPILHNLAESVGRRLRQAEKLCSLITVEIKYATFKSVSHQKILLNPTDSNEDIYRHSIELFDTLWDHTPIRLLGIRTGKLLNTNAPQQLTLSFDNKEDSANQKYKKLDAALDSIRNKYGNDSVYRGIKKAHKPD